MTEPAVADAIAIFDKSATRTRPNAQTAAWAVLRAQIEPQQATIAALEASLAACRADAERYRHVITRGSLPTKTVAGYHYEDGVFYPTPTAAIDAARAVLPLAGEVANG